MKKMNISLLQTSKFLLNDGTFNKDYALEECGKIAGICYSQEGYSKLVNEDINKTKKRIELTLNNGHHSVYDHVYVSINIESIPKILAMVLNNEHMYSASEKSLRYTSVEKTAVSNITQEEEYLYKKWIRILTEEINRKYSPIYNEKQILKLAQENARYFVTVFMTTNLIYTTSLRQINYIASWMNRFINKVQIREKLKLNSELDLNLAQYMKMFVSELNDLNLLDDNLLKNEKNRELSLFNENLEKRNDYFDTIYSTTYKGSFASVAQAQRHRTIDYSIKVLDKKEYFIPPIIANKRKLVNEWLNDMLVVKKLSPQGELVLIKETGKYEDFILKCKERLCTRAQLEIMLQTKETLKKYSEALNKSDYELSQNIQKYCNGARCTFVDYNCKDRCKFDEGIKLTRKI